MTRPLIDDFGRALRSLRSAHRSALLAIALFAVTLGVTAAIYAVVDAVMLRPGIMRDPARVVVVWQRDDTRATPVVELSYGESDVWRSSRSLETLGVFSSVSWPLSLMQGESRTRLAYAAVSAPFFEAAGVGPALGRVFRAGDEAGEEPRVAVISDTLWRQRFGGDPRAVGSIMRLREGIDAPVRSIEIVGVMPRGFEFPRGAQLWLPAAPSIRLVARQANQDGAAFLSDLRVFYGLARLRDDARPAQLEQELGAIARGRREGGNTPGAVTAAVVTPVDAYVLGAARPVLWTMLGGALLMVLLACSSVAGLQVFRAAQTDRALAVHLALGAPRRRLVMRAIAEGVLLAAFGVAGALAVGAIAMRWLQWTAPLDVPRLEIASLTSGPVLAFVGALAVMTAVLAGAWPALFAGRIDAGRTLTSGARAVMQPRERRLQRLVVGWQVAIAVMLLAGAALFIRSVQALDRIDAGFRADGLAVIEIESSFAALERADVFYDGLLARVRDLSGVTSAGAVYLRPLSGPIGNDSIPVLAGQEGLGENAPWRRNPRANLESVTPGAFQAFGVPLLRGRDFTAADVGGARDVVIVSASAAARYWPGQSPLGQRLVVAGQRMPPRLDELRWQTVVGVVGDVRYRGLLDPRLDIYVPAAQSTMRVKDVLLRTNGDLDRIVAQVRAIARELDPGVFVGEVVRMRDALARESAPWRFAMRVLMFFGVLALVLATVGLTGVVWLVVAMRRRELGVRAALGATPAHLRRHALADAIWTGGAATAVGLMGALVAGRAVGGFLVGVSANDALSLAGAVAVTLAAAAAGCLLAARGAARSSPVDALRD